MSSQNGRNPVTEQAIEVISWPTAFTIDDLRIYMSCRTSEKCDSLVWLDYDNADKASTSIQMQCSSDEEGKYKLGQMFT